MAPRYETHSVFMERLKEAESKISNQSPKLDVRRFLDVTKLKEYVANYRRMRKVNNELMVRLNEIQRLGGKIYTFEGYNAAKDVQSRVPVLIQQYRQWEKENVVLGNRLLERGPEVECWMDETKLRVPMKKRIEIKFEVPFKILAKYSQLMLPNELTLKTLMRPLVFLHFYIKDLRPVGRIVLKLYTEACPQVVLALVRACRNGDPNHFAVKRLFPSLWMDLELTLGPDDRVNLNKTEYDKRALDHSRAGVLHFSRHIQHVVRDDVFLFSISSKPLNLLTGKRVAFGRIIRGLRVLESMEYLGMKKCGKLKRRIIVTKVGVMN